MPPREDIMITSTPEFARVTLRGTITKIVSYHPDAEHVQRTALQFTLTTTRKTLYKRDGTTKSTSMDIPCVVFGKLAQTLYETFAWALPLKVYGEGNLNVRPVDSALEVLVTKLYTDEVFDPTSDCSDIFFEEAP
jgi:hypothetical protein